MLVWQAHKTKVRSLVFSPDGTRIATTADKSGTVCLWHAPTGQLITKLISPTGSSVLAVAFFPDGLHLAVHLNAPSIHIRNVETCQVVTVLVNDITNQLDALAVSPDGSRLFARSFDGIAEWDEPLRPTSGTPREADRDHSFRYHGVSRISFSRTGAHFAIAGFFMHLHTPNLKKETRRFRDPKAGDKDGASVNCFAFNAGDSRLVLGLGQRAVVWSPGDLEASPVLIAGHGKKVMGVGFLPGNKVLTAGMDGTARAWDQDTGAELRSFAWGIGKVTTAAVSPDGTLCAAGSADGRVIVWDVDS